MIRICQMQNIYNEYDRHPLSKLTTVKGRRSGVVVKALDCGVKGLGFKSCRRQKFIFFLFSHLLVTRLVHSCEKAKKKETDGSETTDEMMI